MRSASRLPVLLIATSGAPSHVAGALRARSLPDGLSVSAVSTGPERLNAALGRERAASRLVGALALLALTIACLGLAATAAFTVAQRRREIAVRMAVGGSPAQIARQVLRQIGWLVAAGVTLGTAAAAAALPLFGVHARGAEGDWTLLAASGTILLVCCGMAGVVPALRAARVDPARALR
jgi:ABC-type antimicrobial peptide transport system permease subunit